MLNIIITIVTLVAAWMVYQKMGRAGWEGIIPIYSTYVMCEELYGNGLKFLFLLIPFYNIYFAIRMEIDLAHAFHKGGGFCLGLIFLNPIFMCILAFDSNSVYGDNYTVEGDIVSDTVNGIKDKVESLGHDPKAAEKLEELKSLHDNGIITDEEYEDKRQDILKRM